MFLDWFACGHYRLIHPMKTLKEAGHITSVAWAAGPRFDIRSYSLEGVTHVIAQRQFDIKLLEYLEGWRKQTGGKLLYEVDDYLHQIHPESHAFKVFKPGGEALRLFERWVRACDGLIVTTPELAAQYRHLNNRVFVVPNYIDFNIRDWETPVSRAPGLEGKTVIGWAGGSTHAEDDEPLRGVLSGIQRDYPDVVVALCSHPSLVRMMAARQELIPEQTVFLAPTTFEEYTVVPAQFDIGIAPLRNTVFNRSKSWLKVMEYGARRVPYVASDIASYRRFHRDTDGCGGFLAEGKSEWDTALRHLLDHPEARRRRGDEFRRHIKAHYSIAGNIGQWEEVLQSVTQPHVMQVWDSKDRPGRNDPCPCGSGKKYKRCCEPAFG